MMIVSLERLLRGLILNSLLNWIYCEQFEVQQTSFRAPANDSRMQLVLVPLLRTPYVPSGSAHPLLNDSPTWPKDVNDTVLISSRKRNRRAASLAKRQSNDSSNSSSQESDSTESSFDKDEVGWSNINAEVDMVIPTILVHLQKLGIEHFQLPDMKETISLNPLFITYEAGLFLSNGIVYNIAGIQRYGDAFMTYEDKSFICRFNLVIKTLQFEYDFLIKLMPLEAYGRVIGSLDDTIIYGDLAIGVIDTRLKLNDFRIMKFGNIHVQLDQRRIIRQLSGAILSPITNFFRDRITTSISDGLKDQMQLVMDDFSDKDPLQLRTFAKQMLAGLTGH